MNVTSAVSTIFEIKWEYGNGWGNPKLQDIKFRPNVLNDKDTYWLIFNRQSSGNKEAFEYLLSYPGIKIVYQSVPAVNGNSGYGDEVRNFLLVFEYEEPVQSLPEVQSQGE